MNKRYVAMGLTTVMILSLASCGSKGGAGTPVDSSKALDPNNPVSLTVWHYYNGAQQAAFDSLVEKFNDSVGKEQGIFVEGFSQGSVTDLENALTDSIEGVVGAGERPDIFSSYSDTAYAIQKSGKLADLSNYLTADELSEYVESYVQEGRFIDDQSLYLFPVAKSTEIMMMNKTDWEPFAAATGVTEADLSTIEGVVDVAKQYYEWTDSQTPDIANDGKAFYGRDSLSNYFIIGMRQLGTEIFNVTDGKLTFNTDKAILRKMWDNYYVPYVNGYFGAYGKFRSDDVKTGDILAFTGSTTSTMYFPDNVEADDTSYPIDYEVLAAPSFEGGENVNVQQGAGMAVMQSDEAHEYASIVFLKWFTEADNNLAFGCASGYMPVKKAANNVATLDSVIADQKIEITDKTYDCLSTLMTNFDKITLYTPQTSDNGSAARKVLDYNLSDKAAADKTAIEEAIAGGESRDAAIAPYVSDEAFEEWYTAFCAALEATVTGD